MIPKKIHYCWFGKNEKSKLAKRCVASWYRLCPDYEIIEWNESNFDLDYNEYTRWCYDNKKYAFLSDLVRLLVVNECGGVYLDLDVELLKRPDELLKYDAFFGFESDAYVNTGMGFGAIPHHPVVEAMKKEYLDLKPEKNGAYSGQSCPILNTEALVKLGLVLNGERQRICGAEILTADYLNPYEDATGRLFKTSNTVSVHWYAKTWLRKSVVIRSNITRPFHRWFGIDCFEFLKIKTKKFTKQIRVLHCFGRMDVGGAETMLMNLYRHIDRERFQFDFLVFSDKEGKYDTEIKRLGGNIYVLPSLGKAGPIEYIWKIKKFLDEHPYQVVHSHIDWQGAYITIAARWAGVRVRIVHSHSVQKNFACDWQHSVAIGFSKLLIELGATKKLACSREAAEGLFLNLKNTVIIRNAIDIEKYLSVQPCMVSELKKKLGVADSEVVLGHVGSFSENKNQRFLVEILDRLTADAVHHYRLVLVGDGKQRQEIMGLVQEKGLSDKVIFTGLQKDIPLYASMFDCFLFPSVYEGLGIVAIEAQALGVPCIISDTITREVDLDLGITQFLNLKKPEDWVYAIHNRQPKLEDKEKIRKSLVEHGYDVKDSVVQLEKLYQTGK